MLNGSLYTIHAISPIHVGCEDSLGSVNSPTMREVITQFPLIPGSSIKGVLRDAYTHSRSGMPDILQLFGPETTEAHRGRGGMVFSDAQLLALPVRSLNCLFVWLTCPTILRRLTIDTQIYSSATTPARAKVSNATALIPKTGKSSESLLPVDGSRIFVEEYLVDAEESELATERAERIAGMVWPGQEHVEDRELFLNRFAIVSDDLFGLLCQTCLEVRARVKIDADTGAAAESGPWNEELMPTETLLYGIVHSRRTAFTPSETDTNKQGKPSGQIDAESSEESDASHQDKKSNSDEISIQSFDAGGIMSDFVKYCSASDPLLRFGGKSSVGYGRAFFRLALYSDNGQNQ